MNKQFLYLIADAARLHAEATLVERVQQLILRYSSAIAAIHFRGHLDSAAVTDLALESMVRKVLPQAKQHGVALRIHKDCALATRLACDAPETIGAHLGAEQLLATVTSKEQQEYLKHPTLTISASVHSLAQLRSLAAQQVAYCFYSPVFSPFSKPSDRRPTLGIAGLRAGCVESAAPIIALGGISPERVAPCRDAGAKGVAVLSGILLAEDPMQAIESYVEAWNT